MATISKTGISNGSTIESEHITRIIDALDGTSSAEIVATGSFSGSFTGNMAGTASFATTASYAENAGGSPSYYNLNFTHTQDTPSDATTYYIGNGYRFASTTDRATPPKAMVAGTITEAFLSANTLTPGTDQTTTVTILNIDTNLSSSVGDMLHNDYTTYVSASISPGLTVNAGDRIAFKIETPTWATNPTGSIHTGYVLIQI